MSETVKNDVVVDKTTPVKVLYSDNRVPVILQEDLNRYALIQV